MAIKKEDYLYISSLLRAREGRMLSREKAERMLDAPGFEECAKMLADSGYEDMSQMNIKAIEDSLSDRRAAIFKEMESLVPNAAILDLFRIKYDYHNAKVLIKSDAMNIDESTLLSDSGRVAPELIKKRFQEDKLRDLPGLLGTAAEEARNQLSRSGNPQLADFILDKAYFAELRELADVLESDFARGYAAILADSTNLKSAVRILRMGKDIGYLKEALVPGGSVSEERIGSGISGEGIASVFAGTSLSNAAVLGADAVSGGTLTAFELACDNAIERYLEDAKLVPYGDAPVIAYLAATENELTAVRMILTGRLAGVSPNTIRERLRDLYA